MKLHQRITMAGAATVVAVALVSCGSNDGGAIGGDDDRTPEQGGTLNVYVPNIPATLLPGEPSAEYVDWPIYGTLIRFDENDEPVGVLAESFEPEDASTWVLTLRDDLVFSDGTPFDAEAVKYNWAWHAVDENRSQARSAARQIASMEVVDPTTLRVKLVAPNVEYHISVATGPLNAVGSPTAMEADIEAFKRQPVAAGPFLVEEWIEGDHLTLIRNPDYFDPEKPYVDEMVLVPVTDFEQRLNVMSTGEDAVALAIDAREQAEFKELGLEVFSPTPNGGYQYLLNTASAPFNDVRVRQAMVQAIDLEALNQAVYDGHQRWEDVPFRSTSPFFSEDTHQLRFDKGAAQTLVDEYVDEVGPIEFTIVTTNAPPQALEAQWLAQEFNTLEGVTVKVDSLETNAFAERVTTGQFEMGYYGTNFMGSGANYRARLLSTAPQNYERYTNPEVDRLFAEAASAVDLEQRTTLVQEIQQITFDEAPIFWTWGNSTGWAASGSVDGVAAWGQDYFAPEDVFVLPAR